MRKKQFKTESKKLLDMMINSIYTHKEIFLRELISNASDAIDKLYFRSLTDSDITLHHDDYEIRISVNKDERTLTISDNGCGMDSDELENNLGVIAKSGSFDFKNADNENTDKIDIIGQFGVGFYSAFMVSDEITVQSRPYGSDKAWVWTSKGIDGYSVDECDKEGNGTVVILHLKPDTDDENYSDFLEEYRIKSLVRKYSDYIRYPIRMLCEHSRVKEDSDEDKPEYETYLEDDTLNSMIPIWKKPQNEVTDEEYASFYTSKFADYEAPLKTIRQRAEGTSNYEALMFIPAHAPYDYYSREYEKGLQLYSSGVMIMEKCKDLLPDHFSFVKGLVDSADLSLNISREMLQHDRQLKIIAKAIEKKIAGELKKMLSNDRENYEKFYKAFGRQLKFGVYSDYGMHKDILQDLLLFTSSFESKEATLGEYVARMKDGQDKIYYAAGESIEQISLLPQVQSVTAHGFEVLYLTDDIDEFAIQMLHEYEEKHFSNVSSDDLDLSTEEEKESLKAQNEEAKDLLDFIKDSLDGAVKSVKFTGSLDKHPVSLSSEGSVSMGMEKTFKHMPGSEGMVKAELVLEINANHPIAQKLRDMYADEGAREKLKDYSKILYADARLISGLNIDNAAEFGALVCDLMLNG